MSPRPNMAKLDADNPFSRRSIGKITTNKQGINSVTYATYSCTLFTGLHKFGLCSRICDRGFLETQCMFEQRKLEKYMYCKR